MTVPSWDILAIAGVSQLDDLREQVCLKIGKGKMSRERWAKMLGIERRTLYRWEQEIINKVLGFRFLFLKRKRKLRYDEYQRFVTLIVSIILKQTGTYEDTVLFFNQTIPGENKKVWAVFGESQIREFLCLN